MVLTITLISISAVLLMALIFAVINLYRKNSYLEDQWLMQAAYIVTITKLMKEFDGLVDKIDSQIWVQSDPELTALFDNIKQMQAATKEYTK
jgi:hypothetical protein